MAYWSMQKSCTNTALNLACACSNSRSKPLSSQDRNSILDRQNNWAKFSTTSCNCLLLKKTPTGQPSTAEAVLAELALDYPLPKVIMEYRGLSKLKSTYTDKLPQMIDPPLAAYTPLIIRQ
jgi:hypothetical protein